MPRSSFPFSTALLAAVAAVVSVHAGTASAAGGVVGSPPTAAAVVEARIAVAIGGATTTAKTTQWASVRVSGAAGGFVWLLPIRPDSAVDLASDAWLEALEQATAPRVVPPPAGLDCWYTATPEVIGDLRPLAGQRAIDTTVVSAIGPLEDHLHAWGFTLGDEMRPKLETVLGQGYALLAMTFAGPVGEVATRTVRIVGEGAPVLPLVLTRARAEAVRVTAFAFATGRARFGIMPPLLSGATRVAWSRDGTSTYARLRNDALVAGKGHGYFLETTGPVPIFGLPYAVDAGVTIPSIVESYGERTLAYGESGGDDSRACVAAMRALARDTRTVSAPCPRGEIRPTGAGVDGGACTEPPVAGELAPSVFRCGGIADDLAFALAGKSPASVWITRSIGIVPAQRFGGDQTVVVDRGTARGPIVAADGYGFVCEGTSGGSGTSPPVFPPPPSGQDWDDHADPRTPIYGGPGPAHVHSYDEGGSCGGGSRSSGGGGCSGSTTTTAGNDESTESAADEPAASEGGGSSDDCSSDDEGSGGDDCSADDGSDEGTDDLDCSSDSSDDGGDDCSSGGGEDDCDSSEARPKAASTTTTASLAQPGALGAAPKACRLDKPKPRTKSPVSRVVLGLALLLVPLRRMTRKL